MHLCLDVPACPWATLRMLPRGSRGRSSGSAVPIRQIRRYPKDREMTQPSTERLYFSTTSPYARKARIAAAEKNVPFEAVLDVPWNEDTKILTFNPLGKVPVWITADGTALFDSRVIV